MNRKYPLLLGNPIRVLDFVAASIIEMFVNATLKNSWATFEPYIEDFAVRAHTMTGE